MIVSEFTAPKGTQAPSTGAMLSRFRVSMLWDQSIRLASTTFHPSNRPRFLHEQHGPLLGDVLPDDD